MTTNSGKIIDFPKDHKEFRPCLVDDEVRCLFHKWIYCDIKCATNMLTSFPVGSHALVEYENGAVGVIHPFRLRFLDSAEKFAEFTWPDSSVGSEDEDDDDEEDEE